MAQAIAQFALVVRDYDEAIAWFSRCLKFEVVEDTKVTETKRWVVVRPPGDAGADLLLAKAVGDEQIASIGNQTGGRVFVFLKTDTFDDMLGHMTREGVEIVSPTRVEPYGRVVVFKDLYQNKWDLIEAPSD